jgi:phage/plasmid-like protein (TIGR03299 family)
MSANVEWMFSGNNVTPWHGIGEIIKGTLSSEEAIRVARLDWDVVPMPIYDGNGRELKGYKVNQRSSDGKNLGVVTDRYKIVQNREAFAFTDALLGEGVQYETAGSLDSGKRVWMLARMEGTEIAEEQVDPYLVFTNSHDGKGAVRVAAVPVRVVCQNTLNLALTQASRHWTCAHKGDIQSKLDEARYTLASAERYMKALEEEFGELKLKRVTESQVRDMTEKLLELEFDSLYKKAIKTGKVVDFKEAVRQQKFEDKLNRKRTDILNIYFDKPDLRGTEHTAFRFVNAVSDYATHNTDHKNTRNYQENLFMKTIDGNSLIDTSYQLALAV